jgi:hypothetical protein
MVILSFTGQYANVAEHRSGFSSSLRKQTAFHRRCDRRCARIYMKFEIDAVQIRLDRATSDPQARPDLFASFACRDALQYFLLTLRQLHLAGA